jgi:hypothetical protein
MRTLRLPGTLAFVVLSASAACGGSDPQADAALSDAAIADAAPADADHGCSIFCIPDQVYDDGGMVADDASVMCPPCADPETITCPSGCRPVG